MKNGWLLTLNFVYVLAFFFLFVTALATAYGLPRPELGLVEADPLDSPSNLKPVSAIGLQLIRDLAGQNPLFREAPAKESMLLT